MPETPRIDELFRDLSNVKTDVAVLKRDRDEFVPIIKRLDNESREKAGDVSRRAKAIALAVSLSGIAGLVIATLGYLATVR